jgi:fatty-acyl-CoA synthase
MQDRPLTTGAILDYGSRIYAGKEVISVGPTGTRRFSFGETASRAGRLANALARLGVKESDRVGTFCWNQQEHLDAYFAVPGMGAILHTLNIRLFPDQLVYIANDAADKVMLVDATLAPVLARFAERLTSVETYIVTGQGEVSLPGQVLRYDELVAGESAVYEWPELDERSAAAICYTSGTTGNPKGVVYSHRSNYLHSMAICLGNGFSIREGDRLLLIVPMFHANAWGLPYSAFMAGCELLMPGPLLQAEPLSKIIADERPTFAAAVPAIWRDVLAYAENNAVDLSSLRDVICGGSAVPRRLIEHFEEKHGVRIIQAWGMTETSPAAAVALPPFGVSGDEAMNYRVKSGRPLPGVEARIVDDSGRELPWDGVAVGEIQVRGPWVTGSYYGDDSGERFQDGWLRTGDVGTIDPLGYIQLTDRAKDIIKSGGEWISSVDLEDALMAHPGVLEAAVIGVPDERWDERPLACVVARPGAAVSAEELKAFLRGRVAKWWIPDRWEMIDEIPKTSVGKFDKKVLRARFGSG